MKTNNIHIVEIPEREEKNKGTENILKGIV